MSRTLAHVPLWTRRQFRVAVHDHRDGVCDLPTDPRDQPPLALRRTRCWWDHDWLVMPPVCSCELCHSGSLKRQDRRNDRHRAKVEHRGQGRPASWFDD